MVSVVQTGDASHDPRKAVPTISLSENTFLGSVPSGSYQIKHKQQSECALVLFTQYEQTSECYVMKILREYNDTRYNLKTLSERQLCQIEALRQNKVFTPNIYLGLARVDVINLEGMSISIDELIEYPTPEILASKSEYALIMRQLPDERRLDCLLKENEESVLENYIQLLAMHVAFMHTHLAASLSCEDEARWGNAEHLEDKLLHNFGLLDLVLATVKDQSEETRNQLRNRLHTLERELYEVCIQWQLCGYFEQRIAGYHIKRCHGDLKSPNLWIMPEDDWFAEKAQVLVLDAADFNLSYTNIDVLSDIALLAVDIQVRTQSSQLADLLLQEYLRETNQRDNVSEAVLAYYLVEKAIVGAAISIVYDDLSDLGNAFLEVAEMRLRRLQAIKPGQSFVGSSRSI
jgi:aminoglycoside phosphotransferase family enzyme